MRERRDGRQASTEVDQGALELEALLEQYMQGGESLLRRSPRRGEVVSGTIVSIGHGVVLIDIGRKSEGVVPGHDLETLDPEFREELQVGEQVFAFVVQSENEDGQTVLSLGKARAEQGWRILQKYFDSGEIVEAEVVDHNRGGVIVRVQGVRGFVPLSQLSHLRSDAVAGEEANLAPMLGQKLRLKTIEVNRRRNRLVLSERMAAQEWRVQQKERLLDELREGEIRRGVVTSIQKFGAFVDIGGADGLAHLSELAWSKVDDPHEVVQIGQEVEVMVLSVDRENKRIGLSLRRAQKPTADDTLDRFSVGQHVQGTITKLMPYGAFARVESGIEGLIHLSELADRHVNHPREVVHEGDAVTLKVLRIEPERHRLALSLRQVEDLG